MIVLVFAYLTIAHLASHPTIALSRKFLPPEVKAESSDHNMLKHLKSCLSTLTLICRNPFLRIKVRVNNPGACRPPRAGFLFWKARFPQSGPAVPEKAWVSPAVSKARRTGREHWSQLLEFRHHGAARFAERVGMSSIGVAFSWIWGIEVLGEFYWRSLMESANRQLSAINLLRLY